MYAMEGSWSLGVLIGVPIALVIVFLAVAGAVAVFVLDRGGRSEYDDGIPPLAIFGSAAVVVLIVAGICAWAYYPYHTEYHQWQTHSGTVSDVSNRLISAGDKGGSDQKFVVRFEGSSQQYGCNDTRCSAVKVGDDLTLSCKRSWQYAGTDGYDCNFVTLEAAK